MSSIRKSISRKCSRKSRFRVLGETSRNCIAAQSRTSYLRRLNKCTIGGTTTAARPARMATFRNDMESILPELSLGEVMPQRPIHRLVRPQRDVVDPQIFGAAFDVVPPGVEILQVLVTEPA